MSPRPTPLIGPRSVPRKASRDQTGRYLKAPGPESERPPVLNFTGPPGFGKTTLLRQLDKWYEADEEPPHALVDSSDYPKLEDLPKMLEEIKFQLGRRSPGYGRIPFRRLELALAVTEQPVDFTDQGHAYRRLKRLTRKASRSRRVPEVGGGVLGDVFQSLVQMPLALLRTPVEMIVTAAISFLMSRPLARRRFQKWFGHRDQGRTIHPEDALAHLNRTAQTPRLFRERDELLVDAFLADLRDAYGRGRLSRPGWLSCVVLLDNADSRVGTQFLRHFRHLRSQLQHTAARAEPLLVVTASREPIGGASMEVHPVPAFTENDVEWLASDLPEVDEQEWLPKLIHQTTGYPAAAAALVRTACAKPESATGIDALLAQASTDGPDHRSLEDRLYQDLVNHLLVESGPLPFPDAALDAFITFSAARNQTEADHLAKARKGSVLADPALILQSDLWSEESGTAAHALLRWLLSRRLARRGDGEWSWKEVHATLRVWCRTRGDLAGELHHALAGGDLAAVSKVLADRLSGQDLEGRWLDLLREVTKAPRQGGDGTGEPYSRQVALAKSIMDPARPQLAHIAHLVAGLWLAASPTTGSERRSLHRQISLDYRQVAPYADRPADLIEEADRHERLAEDWH
ncbi:hypothetical protein [Glycomyces buryatensis]|uniref:Uncharacterized protein n=1 Tax=Glycomyces buryatensis TaxID=2570927 RepID=A0A4S8PZ90_9ACTN|nr:hypothetical protein [Glycomyces buryatensis]THV37018.1 hypothetical protein FAB82_20910 [Glycomyces buryatensis]